MAGDADYNQQQPGTKIVTETPTLINHVGTMLMTLPLMDKSTTRIKTKPDRRRWENRLKNLNKLVQGLKFEFRYIFVTLDLKLLTSNKKFLS